jgi:hypothetical protein
MLMAGAWQRCRDVYAGTDVVKAAKTKYLPLLEGQLSEGDKAYAAYLERAMFFAAMERTVAGLIGTILRKPPVVQAPQATVRLLDDLLLTQDSFQGALVHLLQEVFVVGRVGILCDWSDEAQRPYWSEYAAEAITNWREVKVAGKRTLTNLVLEELVPDGEDKYGGRLRKQYRELELLPGGVVTRTWTVTPEGEFFATEDKALTRGGRPVDAIPFVCLGPRRVTMAVSKPPLLDLVDMNLSHYRTSADLEHGRHFTALPTPYVTGWAGNADGSPMAIGSGTAWVIPVTDAKVGMLEFTGQGLEALRKALEDKERLMAVVGARLLEEQPRAAETAEAVRLRQAGEHSALATVVTAVSTGLSIALQWFAWWQGQDALGDKSVGVQLSRDFADARLSSNEAQALMQLWQANGISYETLYWNLQQGEWVRPGVSWEEEQQQIADEDALGMGPEPPEPPEEPPPGDDDDAAPGEPTEEGADGFGGAEA